MVILGPLADVVPIQAIMIVTGLLTFLVIASPCGARPGRRAVRAVHETANAAGTGTGPGEAGAVTERRRHEPTRPPGRIDARQLGRLICP